MLFVDEQSLNTCSTFTCKSFMFTLLQTNVQVIDPKTKIPYINDPFVPETSVKLN